jgi:hypothetical protein
MFSPFYFMCKNVVDEEMSLFSFPSEGFKLKGDRKGRGLFVKSPQQKLRFFIPYLPLCVACIVLKNNTSAFISEVAFSASLQCFLCA